MVKVLSLEPFNCLAIVGKQTRQLQCWRSDLLHHTAGLLVVQIVTQQPQNLLQPRRASAWKRTQKDIVVASLKVAYWLVQHTIPLRHYAIIASVKKVLLYAKSTVQNVRGATWRQIFKLNHCNARANSRYFQSTVQMQLAAKCFR